MAFLEVRDSKEARELEEKLVLRETKDGVDIRDREELQVHVE